MPRDRSLETRTYAEATSEIIKALGDLLLLITFSSKTARCKRRDFEEQTEELRDTAAEIDFCVAELRKLDFKQTKSLHKRLATHIRRYVHLYSFKMKNTWEKLQEMKQKRDETHPLPAMPPIEKLTLHTDVDSGINIELLKYLLALPVGRFSVFCRWLQNRFHYWTCCGTALPPPIRMKCIAEAIVFDSSPPKTDDIDSCPTVQSPVIPNATTPNHQDEYSNIIAFESIDVVTSDEPISSETQEIMPVMPDIASSTIPIISINREQPNIVPYDDSDESDDDNTTYIVTDASSKIISPIIPSLIERQEHSIRLVPYDDTDDD